jgi:carbon-monoxide dehydrogenase medium subunit
VKPAKFAYARPGDLDEALATLAENAEDGKVLAGGQSLGPALNFRLARPSVLIDLSQVPGLDEITDEPEGLRIGAMARQRVVELSPVVRSGCALISQALPLVGHLQNRNRGTIGGSVAHADPASELPAVCLALDAQITAHSVRGTRTIESAEFFQGPFMTALAPDEIVSSIRFPHLGLNGGAVAEIARRHGDFALVGVVAASREGSDGDFALAAFGVGGTPVRLHRAEESLTGLKRVSEADIREAGALAALEVDPASDIHADTESRRQIVSVLVQRTLFAITTKAST